MIWPHQTKSLSYALGKPYTPAGTEFLAALNALSLSPPRSVPLKILRSTFYIAMN